MTLAVETYPLSFAQQRLWFLNQLDGPSPLYTILSSYQLNGDVQIDALEAAFSEVVRRHASLRTTFHELAGAPVQIVQPPTPVRIQVHDLQQLPPREREATARQRTAELSREPFDLSTGPLIRVHLLRLARSQCELVLAMHHIIADRWSMGILFDEVSNLYARSDQLPPVTVQYPELIAEHAAESLEDHLTYWQSQLAGVPHIIDLPTDHARPATRDIRGGAHYFEIKRSTADALKALSLAEGATPFMTLLAAFQVLLHRYSGQRDLVIGSPVAGRTDPRSQSTIGLFINTLALRARFDNNPSFRAFLRQVRETSLDAYAHQDLPFEKLVEVLQPEREPNRHPLFQVFFQLQSEPVAVPRLPGVGVKLLSTDTGTAKFDLTLRLRDEDGYLFGTIEYAAALFEPPTIEKLAGHFQTLVAAIAANPDCCVSTLPLLTPPEERQLEQWNSTQREYPAEHTLHRLLEQQAARTPSAIALVEDGTNTALTYGDLDKRATQLAHHLQALGVGADDCIGVCLERSIDLVVAILGALKAGAAVVPMDTSLPRARIGYVLSHARARVLLTHASLLQQLPAFSGATICLDADWPLIQQHQATRVVENAGPDNLAYVLYTSGSTGTPKGVMVSHRAMVNHLAWRQATYPLSPEDRCLQKASIGFDIGLWELFSPLVAGAQLVLAAPGGQQDSQYLVRAARRHRLTQIHFGPAMLQAFLDEPDVDQLGDLQRIYCGGEPLTRDIWRRFRQRFAYASTRLHNLYGPTETCVDVTANDVTERNEGPLPIGCPIANTRVYVLDRNMRMLPIGCRGELYVSGLSLARGYLGRPDLTADRFVPDPFDDGGRLYWTGDVGRRLPDGSLEFLGRVDQQVKLRGFRIEPGEIETVLREHPAVTAAVVMLREDRPAEPRLVAYLVTRSSNADVLGSARAWLKSKLPEYMLPTAFVILPRMPLGSTGKVDRRALPAPDHTPSTTHVAPRDVREATIADTWARMLGVDRVSVDDDFFTLGGHSLLATRALAQLRSALGVDIPLRALFEAPTPARLAARIAAANGHWRSDPVLALPRIEASAEVPLSFAQERLWFLDQLDGDPATYHIPTAVYLNGELDVAALERSLNEIVCRHEVLRSSLRRSERGPVQRVEDVSLRLAVTDLSDLPLTLAEVHAREVAGEEVQRPFTLAEPPLLRAHLVRIAEQRSLLVLTTHHIVSDGWSGRVLLEELRALYAAFRVQRASPLPPLPIQYGDYALWQRSWLQGDVLRAHLEYWVEQLRDAPQVLELPLDQPRPTVQTTRGAQHSFVLPARVVTALAELAHEEGATSFMATLAAFQVLLHRYTGQSDLLVGSPIAGRTRPETEGLIGFFVNTLPLRARFVGNPTFRSVLRQVRDTCLSAYEHQEVPFEKLVEAVKPVRDLSRNPLVQVLFSFHSAAAPLTLEGLQVESLALDTATAKFDLSLSLVESTDGLRGTFEYATDLFEPGRIELLADHMRVLFESLVAAPDQQIGAAALLTPAEQQRIVYDWNATARDYPRDLCAHQLVEKQARERPDAVAVRLGCRELTYAELNERANALASHLRLLEVGPDVPVAVRARRTPEMIIGVLAVLKAGAAYLPLDPTYPAERLRFVLDDVGAPVLLTERQLLADLPPTGAHLVLLDDDHGRAVDAPIVDVQPDHLSYLIYTSGSTGRPKGIGLPHKGLVNLVTWYHRAYDLRPDDHMAHLAGASFDVGVGDIWTPLTCGASLDLPPDEETRVLPRRIVAWLAERKITVAFLATPLAELVLQDQLPTTLRLRHLLVAGDKLNRPPRAGLPFNVADNYGPAENTIFSTWTQLTPTTTHIGRPLDNVRAYVLDRYGQPVPVGVPGEIYLGGDNIARGYVGRPDLTADRFMPDHLSGDIGGRLYRTGDLARFRPDGTIVFLGRIDHQVKIRGFRIELGEVQSALAQHPDVRDCAVILRGTTTVGDKQLIGYVVPRNGHTPNTSEVRAFLRRSLPEYMLPTFVMPLDALPLTHNGKLDRRALPQHDDGAQPSDEVAPDGMVEERLAAIWCDVLHVPSVSCAANFFELGGHSLLVTQVLFRVYETFGIDLPLRAVFEAPTIQQLGRVIETMLAAELETLSAVEA